MMKPLQLQLLVLVVVWTNTNAWNCAIVSVGTGKCYYQPKGQNCYHPPNIVARCHESMFKRGLNADPEARVARAGMSPEIGDYRRGMSSEVGDNRDYNSKRNVLGEKRENFASELHKLVNKRRSKYYKRNDYDTTSSEKSRSAVLERDAGLILKNQDAKRIPPRNADARRNVRFCEVYKVYGGRCYWQPPGDNCYHAPNIVARCAQPFDM